MVGLKLAARKWQDAVPNVWPELGEGLRREFLGAAVGRVFRRAPRRRLQQARGAIDWAPQAETSQFRAPVSRDRLGLLSYKIPRLFFTHLPKSVFLIPQANFFSCRNGTFLGQDRNRWSVGPSEMFSTFQACFKIQHCKLTWVVIRIFLTFLMSYKPNG